MSHTHTIDVSHTHTIDVSVAYRNMSHTHTHTREMSIRAERDVSSARHQRHETCLVHVIRDTSLVHVIREMRHVCNTRTHSAHWFISYGSILYGFISHRNMSSARHQTSETCLIHSHACSTWIHCIETRLEHVIRDRSTHEFTAYRHVHICIKCSETGPVHVIRDMTCVLARMQHMKIFHNDTSSARHQRHVYTQFRCIGTYLYINSFS